MCSKFLIPLFFVICCAALLSGCGKQKNDRTCLYFDKALVEEVKGANTALVNQEVELSVSFGIYNGCGGFYKFDESVADNTTSINLIAKYEGCICTQNAFITSVVYKFKKSQPGIYELKFFRGDIYINHTITVE